MVWIGEWTKHESGELDCILIDPVLVWCLSANHCICCTQIWAENYCFALIFSCSSTQLQLR